MSWSRRESWHLRLETLRCIKAIILHLLIPRVGKHNMGRIRRVERMERIRGMERMEGVRGVEEAIAEIK